MEKQIIKCPDCKGYGNIKNTTSTKPPLIIGLFTLGIVPVFDKLFSKEWEEECKRCDGKGKILVKFKEE